MNNKSFYKNIILAGALAGTSLTSANVWAASTLKLEYDYPGDANYKVVDVKFSVDKNGKFISDGKSFDTGKEFTEYFLEQHKKDSYLGGSSDMDFDPVSGFNFFTSNPENAREMLAELNEGFNASVTLDDCFKFLNLQRQCLEQGKSDEEFFELVLKDPSLSPQLKQIIVQVEAALEGDSGDNESAKEPNLFSKKGSDEIKNQIQQKLDEASRDLRPGERSNRLSDLPEDLQRVQRALAANPEFRQIILDALQSEGLKRVISSDDVELLQAIAEEDVLKSYITAFVKNDAESAESSRKAKEEVTKNSEAIKAAVSKVADAVKANTNYQKKATETLKVLVANAQKENISEERREAIIERIRATIGDASKAKNVDAIQSVAKPDNYTTHGMMASSQISSSIIDGRVSEIGAMSGLSGGDNPMKFGAWLKGTLSKGEQKAYSMEPGYKFDQTGFTVGADTDFGSDGDFIIGAAASILSNNVKSKKADDTKEKISSYIGNLYGVANFGQAFFSGNVQLGKSDIKKDRHSGDNDNHVAKGKTKGDIYGGKLEAGYNYLIPSVNIIITPSIGVVHSSVSVKGYKETGLGLNRKVAKRDSSRTDGLLGLSTKYAIDMSGFKVMPEVFAVAYQNVNSKNSDTKIYLVDGMQPIVTPGQKLNKNSYKVGAALSLLSADIFDVRFSYDMGIAKKFQSHTGAVKLRVEF